MSQLCFRRAKRNSILPACSGPALAVYGPQTADRSSDDRKQKETPMWRSRDLLIIISIIIMTNDDYNNSNHNNDDI